MPPPTEEDMDDFVFATPKKKKKHKKKMALWLKILIIVVSVILALAIAVTATYFIMKEAGRKAMHNYDDIDISIPIKDESGKEAAGIMDKGRTIKYGGKTYRLNEDIMTVTFIGYNEDEVGESNNYMADAIYIAAIDDHTGKTTILGVSRDTMLDVDIFSADGKYINTEKTQLSYAYSYGNNQVPGGKNVNTSLTRLLFGLPINNYFAIDMASLEELNDAIGGVTLTSKMTFVSKETGQTVNEGDKVTLTGDDVITYVRSRDLTDLKSNNTRMDRQQQYIMAFLQSIVPAAKKDLSTVTKLYGVVSDNADTNLDLPKVTYLSTAALTKLRKASDIEYVRLTGKIKAGEHAEMYLEDKATLETMLKVFYTPVE
jgi:LCP family protein required for cell wall assembly